MRWPYAIDNSKRMLNAEPDLATVPVRRKHSALRPTYPGIFWKVIHDEVEENLEAVLVTYEIWGRGTEEVQRIEGKVRATLHTQNFVEVSGVRYQCLFQGGRDLDIDSEMGVMARSIDFLFLVEKHAYGRA